MASIDVRTDAQSKIDEIIFSDVGATHLKNDRGDVYICDDCDELYVVSIEHAGDMIKALQKAIDLGWIK